MNERVAVKGLDWRRKSGNGRKNEKEKKDGRNEKIVLFVVRWYPQ